MPALGFESLLKNEAAPWTPRKRAEKNRAGARFSVGFHDVPTANEAGMTVTR